MCLSWLVPLSLHKNFEVHLRFTKNTQRSRHVPPCPQKRISQIYLALLLWFKILGMSFSIQNAAVMDNVRAALLFFLKPHEDGDMSVLALSSLGIKTPKIFCMFLSSCSSLSKVGRKSIMEYSPLCWLYISKFVPRAVCCYKFAEFLFPINKVLLSKSKFDRDIFVSLLKSFSIEILTISLLEQWLKYQEPASILGCAVKNAMSAQTMLLSFSPVSNINGLLYLVLFFQNIFYLARTYVTHVFLYV